MGRGRGRTAWTKGASLRAAAALFLSAALAIQPAAAASPGILAKAGGDFEARRRDQTRCEAIASKARSQDLPGYETGPMPNGAQGGLYGVAGAAIAGLLIGAMEKDKARGRAEAFCLSNLGYGVVPLTAEEANAYGKLTGGARDDFERAFLAQDLLKRLEAVLAPKVPPLPAYAEGPGVQGGLKVDLKSLKAADGPVAAEGVAATGRMMRWRTATLEAPFKSDAGQIRIAVEAGTVFHQVDYRPQHSPLLRTPGATWCGQARQTTAAAAANAPSQGTLEIYCLTSQADGYDLFRPTGFAWLAGPYRDGFVLPRLTTPVVLRERESDDLGELRLEIRVVEIRTRSVTLEGRALREGKSVRLWTRRLEFDADGRATLPMWSHRLVLARSGDTAVVAVLEDQGDGRGWREGD